MTNEHVMKSPGRISSNPNPETAVLKSENIELRKKLMLLEAENARLNEGHSVLNMEIKSLKSLVGAD